MTDNLSERERRLVEAVRDLREVIPEYIPLGSKIRQALAAYDPPRKEYLLPTWEEFCKGKAVKEWDEGEPICVLVNGDEIGEATYLAIREATAKEVKP